MASLFTQIVEGRIPCHKIIEDDRYFSFLDIRPINPGHALVIPKKEVDYIFDLDNELLGGAFVFCKRVAAAIKKVVPCSRVGIMVAGLEVPHAHIHLVPINEVQDLNFAKARPADNQELTELAKKIAAALPKK